MKKFEKTLEDVKKLSGSKRERAEALASKIAFMHGELESLQNVLKKKGWVEEYQNGANQHGLKKSSEGEVYNSLVKNFGSALKQLNEMLEDVQGEVDEIEAKYF